VFNVGPPELILILLIALMVFGPKKLPEIGRTVGKSLTEFRKASSDIRKELSGALKDETSPPGTQAGQIASPPVGAVAGEAPSAQAGNEGSSERADATAPAHPEEAS